MEIAKTRIWFAGLIRQMDGGKEKRRARGSVPLRLKSFWFERNYFEKLETASASEL
jgi:hypothetical protein